MDQVVSVENGQGRFEVHSAGAQVSVWDSAEFGRLLFLPKAAKFEVGASPHGGVPVCFPWFGVPTSPVPVDGEIEFLGQAGAKSVHGWARNLNWRLESSETRDDGSWTVRHCLTDADVPTHLLAQVAPGVKRLPAFSVCLTADFGPLDQGGEPGGATQTLTLQMDVQNLSSEPFRFEEALHTYFRVSDVTRISVRGLERTSFLDTTREIMKPAVSAEPLPFGEVVDRVYSHAAEQSRAGEGGLGISLGPITIEDPAFQRQIRIDGKGCQNTVVWNPGPENPTGELASNEWREFVCVETANAWDGAVTLDAGQTHKMSVTYTVSALSPRN